MPEMSDVEIERLKARRFAERVQRVLAVMQEERVDWRAAPFISADGRIGTRVVPVDLPAGRQAGMATRLAEEAPAPRDPEQAGEAGRET